ncbi:MAG: sulfurtransferase [Chloroflexi bacterium]|nr:sulfurtransferase [Chloroflexota bacterium]
MPLGDEQQRDTILTTTDWLAAHLNDPSLRVVDMRGLVTTRTDEQGNQVSQYQGARERYLAGHIPGAIYVDWTRDIIDPTDPVPVQAATAKQLQAFLESVGIGDDHVIVAYDDHPAFQFATRFWWLLQLYGNHSVRVLDGGFPKWQREGRPESTEVPSYPRARFTPRPQPYLRVDLEEVQHLLNAPAVRILDARDGGQYTGVIRRGTFGGHIPGAISIPREDLIDEKTGTFRTDEALDTVLSRTRVQGAERILAYCNGGVAATSVLFALALRGVPVNALANYDGSWNEWGNHPGVPHKEGSEP